MKSTLPPHRVDLVSLRLLLTAVAEGNLAGAAERENIALSAVSRRISDLEVRLGVRLLHRHDRGVRPTAAAEAVIPKIRTVFQLLGQVIADVADFRDGVRGLIRVRAHTTAACLLSSFIARFLERYPGIEVEFDDGSSTEILHAVRIEACDLGLVSGTVQADDLHLIPWSQDELVAVVPPDLPLATMNNVRFSDLLEYPFICMQRGSALLALYRRQAAVLNMHLNERAHVTSFEAARMLVAAGVGVAVLPTSAVRPYEQSGMFISKTLDEPWTSRPLMLCVREMNQVSAATKLMVEMLVQDSLESIDGTVPDLPG